MSEIYIVECPNGFSDKKILPNVKVQPGGTVEVSPTQYRQMKQSNPWVFIVDRRLKLNPGALSQMKGEEKDWQPAPHYVGMLNKDGGMDGIEA